MTTHMKTLASCVTTGRTASSSLVRRPFARLALGVTAAALSLVLLCGRSDAALSSNGLKAHNGLNLHNGLKAHNGLNLHNGLKAHNGLNLHNGLKAHNGLNLHNGLKAHNGLNLHNGLKAHNGLRIASVWTASGIDPRLPLSGATCKARP